MKGNTLVRKMKQLGNITANCMEVGSEMMWENKFTNTNNKKELNKVGRHMARAQRKLDNIWNHNVPRTELKKEVNDLKVYLPAPPEEIVLDWLDYQEVLKRGE